jgi:hypothetical protein
LRFGIRFENEQRPPDAPLLSIGLGQKIYPERVDNANEYQERMTALLELQCRVATAADANYGPLFNPPDRYAMPEGRPIGEAVEDAPRLGVYSPTVLGQFGGPEALFEEPPWYTGELPDGKTVVIGCKEFWKQGRWTPPTDAEFLKTATFYQTDPNRMRERELSDPFTALDHGEYGADICVHRDDISESFTNDDIQLVRAYAGRNRDLRHVDDERFVRNVVDVDLDSDLAYIQRMLAEIPTDATDDDLMISALLQKTIPPSFVRLEDADDENVVTKVLTLNTGVSKIKLLVSLGRVARQDEFGADDLESIEGILDTLHELDDTEDIDQHIRNRLL